MNQNPFITCALVGSGPTPHINPAVPVTPEEIADSALKARAAGAAIVHIHVRDPETKECVRRPDLYREVVSAIREAGSDVVINLTTGMGGEVYYGEGLDDSPAQGSDFVGPYDRIEHIDQLRPEICTLDVGSTSWGDNGVYTAPLNWIIKCAELIKGYGTKPEIELADLGDIVILQHLQAQGLLDDPPFVQICLGVGFGAPASPATMSAMVANLPGGCVWSGFGLSRWQLPMAAQAVLLGGNVRVGLEDNLYLSRGVLATNEQLVERAVRLIESMGAKVAGPAEVRERLRIE